MRKLILGLVAAMALGAPTVLVSTPAHAGTTTSNAPTVTTPAVAKGKTIKVRVNARGSKVLHRTSTLWQTGRRIRDWSPTPGAYRVKSVIRYQVRITTSRSVWVPDWDCADYSDDGWDDNGDGDYDDTWDTAPYDGCAKNELGSWKSVKTTRLGAKRTVTRWTNTRVAADETPGCVSGPEFRAIKDGMTQTKVHSIFGTRGHVEYSGSGGVGREYRTCTGDPDWSYVSVDFNPRVWFKWRYISY